MTSYICRCGSLQVTSWRRPLTCLYSAVTSRMTWLRSPLQGLIRTAWRRWCWTMLG